MPKQPKNRDLFATVFITGAAVLIIEVAAVRILSPIYGSSLYVFSSVLTIILLALSAGYWYGGKRSDKEQSIDYLYFTIALSGFCVLTLLFISRLTLPSLGPLLSPQTGPLLFSLGLFFIPAFMLGIVSPYIIKIQSLTNPPEQIGSVVGTTFFWGTAGSIFGSLVTGFVLIPLIGVNKTMVFVSISLIALGVLGPVLLGYRVKTKPVLLLLIATLIVGVLVFHLDTYEKTASIYASDGIYSSIKIIDTTTNGQPTRSLVRDSNHSSAIFHDSKDLVFEYTKFSLLYDLIPNVKNVLVLGGGAYTIPRTLTNLDANLSIDVVEIEPVLYALAQEYFDLSDTTNITNYPMDGRVFLSQTDKKYDLIFGDIFGTDLAAPFHLTSLEFYTLVASQLSADGVFMINVIGTPNTSSPSLLGSVEKTLRASFQNVNTYRLGDSAADLQNVMFIASNTENVISITDQKSQAIGISFSELPYSEDRLANEFLLTDDHAPVEYLAAKDR